MLRNKVKHVIASEQTQTTVGPVVGLAADALVAFVVFNHSESMAR